MWHTWSIVLSAVISCHNGIMWETCFGKSKVLNDNINKSGNKDFCSGQSGDRMHHVSYQDEMSFK